MTASSISPLPGRVEDINKFPKSTTVCSLQTYLCMVNFYRRLLRGAAQVLKPLTDALASKKAGLLLWSEEMAVVFQASKAAMVGAAELA